MMKYNDFYSASLLVSQPWASVKHPHIWNTSQLGETYNRSSIFLLAKPVKASTISYINNHRGIDDIKHKTQ